MVLNKYDQLLFIKISPPISRINDKFNSSISNFNKCVFNSFSAFIFVIYSFSYFSLIISRLYIHNFKVNDNSFENFIILISKWLDIREIFPPNLDYRILCVLYNNLLVFDSFQGTPCRLIGWTKLLELSLVTTITSLADLCQDKISLDLLSFSSLASNIKSQHVYVSVCLCVVINFWNFNPEQ